MIRVTAKDCRDCYKCLRHCPVKAVRIHEGHAEVIQERCVYDGRCIPVCPQGALHARDSIERVKGFLMAGDEVVASVSPTYALAFGAGSFASLIEALLKLGFARAEESHRAALLVAASYRGSLAKGVKPLISSHCPSVVQLIEKYFPKAIPHLAPAATPMLAHARLLRAAGGTPGRTLRVVRIDACLAEKAEGEGGAGAGVVDAVLTFRELQRWLAKEGIRVEAPAGAGPERAEGGTTLLTLRGGLADLLSQAGVVTRRRSLSLSGLETCVQFMRSFDQTLGMYDLIDMMACGGGCIGGAFLGTRTPPEVCRAMVLAREPEAAELPSEAPPADLGREFSAKPFDAPQPSSEELTRLRAQFTQKLNCGACGFDNCSQKAIALFQGMAEVGMCMPVMRREAVHASSILEHTPNGILLVDGQTRVRYVNPSFRRMFHCGDEPMLGRSAKEYLHADCFRQAIDAGGTLLVQTRVPEHDVYFRAGIFQIEKEDLYCGIFIDTSDEEKARQTLGEVKAQTLQRAQQVIAQQMKAAQEIAGLLGETTADTKVALAQLSNLFRQEDRR